MLGHKVFERLHRSFPDSWCTLHGAPTDPPLNRVELFQDRRVISHVDVLHTFEFHAMLRKFRPDVLVNCVGVIKQRVAANAALPSIRINALLPHELAALCAEWDGRLIHFSTDCVFSGRRGGYSELDISDAEDLYGRTKYLGEVATPNALTLRTSIIGRELKDHTSLLDWFLSQRGKTVRGFRRVIYSGVTTNQMADLVARVIGDTPMLSGLYQVVSEPISKYDLLKLVRDAYEVDIEIEPDDREISDRSMRGDKFRHATGWRAPSWPEMVRELALDLTPYKQWSAASLDGARGERQHV
jgi:dTDP-4-dehydrorhamnose reductase